MFDLREAFLDDPQVRDLLALHQQEMYAISPPGTSFALDLDGLAHADITLFGAWDSNRLAAVAALKRISGCHAEIKSMRTHADHRRRGAAQALLSHLLTVAREAGFERISLETGTSDLFEAAISLYLKNGFVPGEAFAGYSNGPHNQCYHLTLAGATALPS
jgi:putative acetyltransferase